MDPIDGPEYLADPNTVSARLLRAELWEEYNGRVENMLEVMKDAQSVSTPGKHWTYSSTATQALVLLAEAATD